MYIPHDIFKQKIWLKIVAFILVKKNPASGIPEAGFTCCY